jgi:hypothetical protein
VDATAGLDCFRKEKIYSNPGPSSQQPSHFIDRTISTPFQYKTEKKKTANTSGKTSDLYSEDTQFRTQQDIDCHGKVFRNFPY